MCAVLLDPAVFLEVALTADDDWKLAIMWFSPQPYRYVSIGAPLICRYLSMQ